MPCCSWMVGQGCLCQMCCLRMSAWPAPLACGLTLGDIDAAGRFMNLKLLLWTGTPEARKFIVPQQLLAAATLQGALSAVYSPWSWPHMQTQDQPLTRSLCSQWNLSRCKPAKMQARGEKACHDANLGSATKLAEDRVDMTNCVVVFHLARYSNQPEACKALLCMVSQLPPDEGRA